MTDAIDYADFKLSCNVFTSRMTRSEKPLVLKSPASSAPMGG